MARITEKHKRYRTKEQICEDVATILNAPVQYGTKFAVLAEVVWVWSEFDGKYEGCKLWSENASQARKDKLIHEHVVPKKIIIDTLFNLSSPTGAAVKDILSKFCLGVIVTKEEDQRLNTMGLRSKMPDDWDGSDPWARYVAAGIKCKEVI